MKIILYKDLEFFIKNLKNQNKKIVFTTGVFDLLHKAHKEFLKLSKYCGEVLIVGVEGDKRVKKLKGLGRPVEKINTRLEKISELKYVDYVFELPNSFGNISERERLISIIRPDVFAVSSNSPNLKRKSDLVEKYGGKIEIVMEENRFISTTKILKEQRITDKA